MSTTLGAARQVLVLALDGASFDVIEPMVARGRLPHLARWMEEGAAGPLRSTVPPVTFPAWTTFMTGLDPGQHGIFDFTQKLPGQYQLRFVNATDRTGQSLFARVSQAGQRVLVLGMPATHPPEPVAGLLVTGFDAPVSAGTDEKSASDPALYRRIADRVGPWMRPSLKESDTGGDFHERAAATLLERIEGKTRFTLEALRMLSENAGGRRPDLAVIVFSESDTVGHHYWRDHDPASPRHDSGIGTHRRGAIESVYEKLDAACGEIRQAFGEDALCVVVSDHGMGGAARYVVHLNRHLEESGLLARQGPVRSAGSRLARRARDIAVRALPAPIAQAIFRRARATAARLESQVRFGGIDWARTQAFSEEANTQPGVWINLSGREARGCVAPDAYERTRDEVIDCLRSWKLPNGESVVDRARRREDAYTGPFTDRAPDVVVELALDHGYGLSLVASPAPVEIPGFVAKWISRRWTTAVASVRRLEDDELAGGRGRGMNGTHRPDGIFIASEAEGLTGAAPPRSLADVAPWLLERMGIAGSDPGDREGTETRRDYTPEEDAMVAERLRSLGYLE
jgi:predicted AlkP superfamily phosphohydrolase/phosphomutase